MYERVFNRGMSRAGNNYDSQVAELHPSIFQESWIACLTELDIFSNHPTWAKVTPKVELPNFLDLYLPLILPGFNNEEYMNQPAKEDEVIALEINPTSNGNGPKDVAATKTDGDGGGELEGRTKGADLDLLPEV